MGTGLLGSIGNAETRECLDVGGICLCFIRLQCHVHGDPMEGAGVNAQPPLTQSWSQQNLPHKSLQVVVAARFEYFRFGHIWIAVTTVVHCKPTEHIMHCCSTPSNACISTSMCIRCTGRRISNEYQSSLPGWLLDYLPLVTN